MDNLRNKSSQWMIVTAMVCREFKFVKEQYVVEASSFGEAECSMMNGMSYANLQITIPAIERAPYDDICFNTDEDADVYYRVKVVTQYDSETGRVKKLNVYHLVQAPDIETARIIIVREVYKDFPYAYEVADIVRTNIIDVMERKEESED